MRGVRAQFLAASISACVVAGGALAGERPNLIGSFKEWHVYSAGKGKNRSCYALSVPKEMNPSNVNRDDVFFLISSFPGTKTVNQPSIVPGYQYDPKAKAQVQVGSDKFIFFTKNEGGAGGAWMEKVADEKKLVAAMRRGSNMIVTGTSMRGTLTTDEYSLAGFSAAVDKLGSSCK
jgi:Invasion associated locus B (IalB) protein